MLSPRADFLLVDIGNTFTKFQLASTDRLRRGVRRKLLTAELTPSRVIALLDRWSFRRVALCSVVPTATEVIAETLPEPLFTLKPGARRSAAQFGGVDLSAYPRRNKLGPDRLANLCRRAPPPRPGAAARRLARHRSDV